MPRTRIAIHGAGGRMGQRLVALATADPQLELVAALEHDAHPQLGRDAGLLAGCGETGVLLAAALTAPVDVVIDFSVPKAALKIVGACVERKIPLVLATTGFESAEREQIAAAARQIALLWSPNMSLAVNLTMQLAAIAAKALAGNATGVDVEIIERHHHFKEDAPSGTALKFGEIIAAQMGQKLAAHGRHGRPGKRPAGEIGYHAVRVGDNPGEHTIIFGLSGETIELRVGATNRDCYAQGALAAAKFLAGKPAGLYSMANVLGLEQLEPAK
ncbi:MAG: 4-hydroxy-tetrahydrodipicolinate reductase [Pirellulales bacterium]|nr:4-hydroxy-tetrahydrodipicolinate reductase [Pirellulales bacterium]